MVYLTKLPEAFAVPEATATATARLLVEQIISRHGTPECLLSDRGSHFLGCVVHEVDSALQIKKLNTTAYHPQTDGLVERF